MLCEHACYWPECDNQINGAFCEGRTTGETFYFGHFHYQILKIWQQIVIIFFLDSAVQADFTAINSSLFEFTIQTIIIIGKKLSLFTFLILLNKLISLH